jgi:hypothetical protein
MSGACSTHGEMRNTYKILVGRPEGTRSLRPRRRWEDNIKIALNYVGCKGVGWNHLAQVKNQWWVLVNMVMNLRVE